jgi:EAL domain-containing protein (putative c-di-GMP-specific phosphodiesterase class I)
MGLTRHGWVASLHARGREDVMAVIDRGSLTPVFQPIVDLRTCIVAGYEALSRFTRGQPRPARLTPPSVGPSCFSRIF